MDLPNINDLVVCCRPKTDKHFVKDPRLLECLHSICRRCVNHFLNNMIPNIECIKCGKVTNTGAVLRIEHIRARKYFKIYLHNIFRNLEKEAIGYFRKLNSIFQMRLRLEVFFQKKIFLFI
jgi:hypothetical protein